MHMCIHPLTMSLHSFPAQSITAFETVPRDSTQSQFLRFRLATPTQENFSFLCAINVSHTHSHTHALYVCVFADLAFIFGSTLNLCALCA